MKPLQYAPKALNDLRRIAEHIGRDNPARATTFIEELRDKAAQAARRPQSFRSRDDIRSGLRSAVYKRYILLFRELDDVVRIERVIHGAQDFGRITVD